jgi:hypothetical protein
VLCVDRESICVFCSSGSIMQSCEAGRQAGQHQHSARHVILPVLPYAVLIVSQHLKNRRTDELTPKEDDDEERQTQAGSGGMGRSIVPSIIVHL